MKNIVIIFLLISISSLIFSRRGGNRSNGSNITFNQTNGEMIRNGRNSFNFNLTEVRNASLFDYFNKTKGGSNQRPDRGNR